MHPDYEEWPLELWETWEPLPPEPEPLLPPEPEPLLPPEPEPPSRSPCCRQSRSRRSRNPCCRRSRSPCCRRSRSPCCRRSRSPCCRQSRSPCCRQPEPPEPEPLLPPSFRRSHARRRERCAAPVFQVQDSDVSFNFLLLRDGFRLFCSTYMLQISRLPPLPLNQGFFKKIDQSIALY